MEEVDEAGCGEEKYRTSMFEQRRRMWVVSRSFESADVCSEGHYTNVGCVKTRLSANRCRKLAW